MTTMRTMSAALLLLCALMVLGAILIWNDIEHSAATQQLRLAAAGNDAAGVSAALDAGASAAESLSASSNTSILVQQVHSGNTAIVSELLTHDPDIPQLLREIALAIALKQPDGEILKLLLTKGWKPGAESIAEQLLWLRKDDKRLQLLQKRWPEIVREALTSRLREALKSRSKSLVERAIAAGAALSELTSADCCFTEQKRYTNRSGNNVYLELKTPYGRKLGPLQTVASKEKSSALIEFLLAQGLPVDAQDSDGKTALMWALWERNFYNAQTLLKAGANPNATDQQGRNAMTYAVLPRSDTRYNNSGVITIGGRRPSNSFTLHGFTILLNGGLDPTLKDKKGRNALDYIDLFTHDNSEKIDLGQAWARYQATQSAAKSNSGAGTENAAAASSP